MPTQCENIKEGNQEILRDLKSMQMMHKCKRRRTSSAHDSYANIVSSFMLLELLSKASLHLVKAKMVRLFPLSLMLVCMLASPKRKPKVYAIWKWTLFTCYRKIIIPTELSEGVWQGEGLAKWNIMFQYYAWDDYKFPCMTRAGRARSWWGD